jgi:hypothetical protein
MSEAGLKDPMLPSNRSTTFYAGHAEQKHNAAQAEYDRSAALVRHRSPEILLGSFLIAQRVRPTLPNGCLIAHFSPPARTFRIANGSIASGLARKRRERASYAAQISNR